MIPPTQVRVFGVVWTLSLISFALRAILRLLGTKRLRLSPVPRPHPIAFLLLPSILVSLLSTLRLFLLLLVLLILILFLLLSLRLLILLLLLFKTSPKPSLLLRKTLRLFLLPLRYLLLVLQRLLRFLCLLSRLLALPPPLQVLVATQTSKPIFNTLKTSLRRQVCPRRPQQKPLVGRRPSKNHQRKRSLQGKLSQSSFHSCHYHACTPLGPWAWKIGRRIIPKKMKRSSIIFGKSSRRNRKRYLVLPSHLILSDTLDDFDQSYEERANELVRCFCPCY